MKPAVLFDLGNTLAAYCGRDEFQPILETAVANVLEELCSRNIDTVDYNEAIVAAAAENREAADFRFRPIGERLIRIFRLPADSSATLLDAMCRRFLAPVFEIARVYDDTFRVLRALKLDDHPTAIVSNAPLGSPPSIWRDELKRLSLDNLVDAIVMCGDVGWRKPAPQIFEYAAAQLGISCDCCFFVGDDFEWDVEGAFGVGMQAILIDCEDRYPQHAGLRVHDLFGAAAIVTERTGTP